MPQSKQNLSAPIFKSKFKHTLKWAILGFVMTLSCAVLSQAHYGVGKNQELLDAFFRLELKYSTSKYPAKISNLNGFLIKDLLNVIDFEETTQRDIEDIEFLKNQYSSFFSTIPDNPDKKKIFFTKGHFLSYENDDLYVQLDPTVYIQFGDDTKNDGIVFRNTRGFRLSGNIRKKVFFRTALFENQAKFLPHIEQRISDRNSIPGQGFFKTYQSSFIDNLKGWDYLNAEAMLTYRPSEYFRMSIGHGNHFLGNGYHSLLLSDYSDNYFYLEFNTSIGIFNYKNIFAALAPIGSTIDMLGDELAPKKYMAAHYLSIKPHKNLEFSLFESVIFGREDHFEFQYLNPLILYRVVEQKLDSPDNVMIGLDINYRIRNRSTLYGQLLIDEMKIGELLKSSGWWGNKIAYQLGLRHIDFLDIDHLDLLVEYNSVRPFTYSHRTLSEEADFSIGAYSHYNQELAHPLGANFRELLGIVNYMFNTKWSIQWKALWAATGKSDLENHGENILIPNESRVQDFDNKIAQGNKTKIFQLGSILTYSPWNNYYADLHFLYRNQNSENGHNDSKSLYFAVSIRANMSHQKLDY